MNALTPSQYDELVTAIVKANPRLGTLHYSRTGYQNIIREHRKMQGYIGRMDATYEKLSEFLKPFLAGARGRGMVELSAAMCKEIADAVHALERGIDKPVVNSNPQLVHPNIHFEDVLKALDPQQVEIDFNSDGLLLCAKLADVRWELSASLPEQSDECKCLLYSLICQ